MSLTYIKKLIVSEKNQILSPPESFFYSLKSSNGKTKEVGRQPFSSVALKQITLDNVLKSWRLANGKLSNFVVSRKGNQMHVQRYLSRALTENLVYQDVSGFHQYLCNGSPQIKPRNHGVWLKGSQEIQGQGRFGQLG